MQFIIFFSVKGDTRAEETERILTRVVALAWYTPRSDPDTLRLLPPATFLSINSLTSPYTATT